MQNIDQIIEARWIATVNESDTLLENQAVAIHRERIVDINSRAALEQTYSAQEVTVLENHLLIPGLVNAHTHAAMSLLRGYADDLPLMEWLNKHIWPAESRWVDAKFVAAGTDLALCEMIRGGTTTFNDMYFFPDVVAGCSVGAGVRVCVGMIVIDFPTVWAQNADEYINKGLEVRDEFRHAPLVNAAFAPHAPYTVSDKALERISVLAEELDCQVHMHVHETAHEIEESTARFGMRPLERLGQLELLSPRLIAVHMTELLSGEIRTIAERGVHVVHCPESNLKLASGMCPVATLQAAGVCVSIGTDGASSNNDLDMLGEIRTGALLAKGVSGDPTAMNANEALRAATINGARALGMDQETGSIEIGKAADLVAIDLNRPATQPVYQPVSQAIYSASREQVTDVWINGRRLMQSRTLLTIDEDKSLADTRQWGQRIGAAHH